MAPAVEVMFKAAVKAELSAIKKREAAEWLLAASKAGIGAVLGAVAYSRLTEPVQERLMDKFVEGVEISKADRPIPIEKDQRGTDLLKWINRFRKDHPETKDVPVYVSGRVPNSQYITSMTFKIPGEAETLKKEWKITKPGIYIRELAAPVALHELGHVAMDRKVPGITLLTHGMSSLALPLLAYAIFKKPKGGMLEKKYPKLKKQFRFVDRWSPAISAALQVPLLAEEAGASIIAEKTLRARGETGKERLLPAWMTYAVGAGTLPIATAAAKFLKRL